MISVAGQIDTPIECPMSSQVWHEVITLRDHIYILIGNRVCRHIQRQIEDQDG